MKRILIIGAGGQIGSELTVYLRKIYGDRNVVATDMRECKALGEAGPFEVLNALDATAMASVVARYHIDSIFNLVALLSAVGERNPQMAWNVNMGALNNSLEVARQHHCALFTPSSIGAFGPTSPKDRTPQDTIMQPTTIYGHLQGHGRNAGQLLPPQIRRRYPLGAFSGHYFERHAARRRHDRLCGRDLLRGHPLRAASPAPCRRTSIWT